MFLKQKRVHLIVLGLVITGLLVALWLQSLHIHSMYRNLNWPNTRSRQLGDERINRWMTVEEVARRYHVDTSRVFAALDIQAQPGDEKLPLWNLGNKYRKSMQDIDQGLKILKQQPEKQRDQNHE